MAWTESLYNEDIISDGAIAGRLDYLDFLDDTSDLSEDDREFWEDEIEELAELKTLVAAVGSDTGGLISEHYWPNYAAQDAEDAFDLNKTGAYKYFDYDSYADDLQTEFSQVEFHGTTYYYQ
jgi:hypothetical protein